MGMVKKSSIYKKLSLYKRTMKSLDEYRVDIDEPQLKKTIPPKGESLKLRSTWVSEAFTSSQVENLIKSISRLGWDKAAPFNNNHDLASWIKSSRVSGDGQGWSNGGIVRDIKSVSRGLTEKINSRYAKLPKGVNFAHLYLHKISSSVTIITMQFIHSSEVSESMNNILASSESKAYVKYHPSKLRAENISYISSTSQKRESLNNHIDKIHQPLYDWFHKNIPGYFSDNKTALPTVDFITSSKFKFTDSKDVKITDYLEIVFGYGNDNWCSTVKNGLRLILPSYFNNNIRSFIFGNENELSEGLGVYGAEDKLTAMTGHMFHKTASMLATHNLLEGYEKDLLTMRDRASRSVKSLKKALDDADYVRNSYLAKSKDIRMAAKELNKSSKFKHSPYSDSDTLDFSTQVYRPYGENKLSNDIAKIDFSISKQLIELEDDMKDIMMSSSATGSTIANLRIQRWVFWLTIVTVFFTAVNIWMAIDSKSDTNINVIFQEAIR